MILFIISFTPDGEYFFFLNHDLNNGKNHDKTFYLTFQGLYAYEIVSDIADITSDIDHIASDIAEIACDIAEIACDIAESACDIAETACDITEILGSFQCIPDSFKRVLRTFLSY